MLLLLFLYFFHKDFLISCIMIMVSEAFRFVICSAIFYPVIQWSRVGRGEILIDAAQK